MTEPVEVLCCYTQGNAEDEADLEQLLVHLRLLERHGFIRIWHAGLIEPGEDAKEVRAVHMRTARLILLLTSASFLSTNKQEIEQVLQSAARVVPIKLRPYLKGITPLDKNPTSLPADGRPINRSDEHAAWTEVAESVYKNALSLQIEALLEAGDNYRASFKFEQALSAYAEALALTKQPDGPETPASILALLYQGRGRALTRNFSLPLSFTEVIYEQALVAFEQALEHDPTLLLSLAQKGLCLFYLRRYDEALKALDKALLSGSSDPSLYEFKFHTLVGLKRKGEAIALYEELCNNTIAFWFNISLFNTHEQAAELFEQTGHFEKALAALERSYALSSKEKIHKARLLEHLERYTEALACYEHIANFDATDAPLAYVHRGLMLEYLARPQEALSAFEEALRLRPELGEAYAGKQRIYTSLAHAAQQQARHYRYTSTYRCIRTLRGYKGAVLDIAFSSDNRLLASASYGGSCKVWEVASGTPIFSANTSQIKWSVAFSPDGRFLVSGQGDGTLIRWDFALDQPPTIIQAHQPGHSIYSLAFHPHEQIFVSASSDQTVKWWDLYMFEQSKVFSGHTGNVNSCAFSFDGRILASASSDGDVILWKENAKRSLLSHIRRQVYDVTFSPDGATLASASESGITLWSLATDRQIQMFSSHSGAVRSVAFYPDGRILASAEGDESIRLWDCVSGQEIQELNEHSGPVYSVAFSPDGQTLASGSSDGTVKLWRLQ